MMADEEQVEKIRAIEEEVLQTEKYSRRISLAFTGGIKRFYSKVTKRLNQHYGWSGYYNEIHIIKKEDIVSYTYKYSYSEALHLFIKEMSSYIIKDFECNYYKNEEKYEQWKEGVWQKYLETDMESNVIEYDTAPPFRWGYESIEAWHKLVGDLL